MFEFSLIIPCYNEEANLTILFKKLSLLTQSRNNIEIIIVNNGSTDRSSDFFKKNILSKNNQMKLIEIKKNKGYGDGIIEGVEVIGKKFCIGVQWHPEFFATEGDPNFNLFKSLVSFSTFT